MRTLSVMSVMTALACCACDDAVGSRGGAGEVVSGGADAAGQRDGQAARRGRDAAIVAPADAAPVEPEPVEPEPVEPEPVEPEPVEPQPVEPEPGEPQPVEPEPVEPEPPETDRPETVCGTALLEAAGAAHLEVRVDGQPLPQSWDDAPLLRAWDTTRGPGGFRVVALHVTGHDGVTTVDERVVYVDQAACGAPPTIELLHPERWIAGPTEVRTRAEGAAELRIILDGAPTGAILDPPDGSHTLRVIAIGVDGQIATDHRELVADRTPPRIELRSPTAGEPVHGRVRLVAAVSDAVGVAAVRFHVAGRELALDAEPWTATVDLTDVPSGRTPVQLEAVDLAGNVGRGAGTLRIDRPPVVAFVAPAPDAELTGAVVVEVAAEDDLGLAGVELFVDDVSAGTLVDGRLEWTPPAPGPHTLRAVATDDAGQQAVAERRIFVERPLGVDLLDCTAACAALREGAELRGLVRLQAEVREGAAARVAFSVDDEAAATSLAPPYVLILDTTTLENGPHTVAVSAVDAAGRAIEIRRGVVVDNEPPGLAPQTGWGPAARIDSLRMAADAEAARAAGCTLVGAEAGTSLGRWIAQIGVAEFDALVRRDADGRSPFLAAVHVAGWREGSAVGDARGVDMRVLELDRVSDRHLVKRSTWINPDSDFRVPRANFSGVIVGDDGWFSARATAVYLPFPLSDDVALTVWLNNVEVTARMAVDGVSFRLDEGVLQAYWNEAAIVDWVGQLQAACAGPLRPDLCDPFERLVPPGTRAFEAIPALRQLFGGFDVAWNNGRPRACAGEDCDSISVCFAFTATPDVVHGVEGEEDPPCVVACDPLADCATWLGACPDPSPRERVAERAACIEACEADDDLRAALEDTSSASPGQCEPRLDAAEGNVPGFADRCGR